MKRLLYFLVYFCFLCNVYAQNIYNISYSNGYTICSSEDINNNFNQKFSLRYLRSLNNSTYIGGVLNISDYNHDVINGYKGSFGTIASLGVSILHSYNTTSNITASVLIENGIGYVFKPYNYISNPENTLGGRFQIFFNAGFYFTYKFKKSNISIGPEFTHFSNSGLKQKNGGLNTLSLSVRYDIKKYKDSNTIYNDKNELYMYPKFHIDISGGIGFGDNMHNKNDISAIVNTSVLYNYYKRCFVGIGLDYFGKRDDIGKSYIGISCVHEISYGNIVVNAQLGYYINGIHQKAYESSGTRIYEKIGMKYIPSKRSKVYLGYYVKGNEFTAECLNFYIGCKI